MIVLGSWVLWPPREVWWRARTSAWDSVATWTFSRESPLPICPEGSKNPNLTLYGTVSLISSFNHFFKAQLQYLESPQSWSFPGICFNTQIHISGIFPDSTSLSRLCIQVFWRPQSSGRGVSKWLFSRPALEAVRTVFISTSGSPTANKVIHLWKTFSLKENPLICDTHISLCLTPISVHWSACYGLDLWRGLPRWRLHGA